ncbi:tyrosine-type recombinase/integrase [Natronococcus occultus]|uniref:Site-specific recombinase XerD n=1 Tax=Natronococcus occultus SP4 TaxID=694430 RepID=L0K422_9EURY|nr:tyrosine-type recombinase/integrase [Natronococcus occultus]AGB40037.1 site-specific recombinase XerD [Natronococcus occultus SP4]
MSSSQIQWSHKSLEELREFWNTEIELALQRAGHDLEDKPSYQDLLDVGYGGLTYTLREHHEMTLSEFLESVGYVAESDDGYPWGIDDETTITELESFVQTLERRQGLTATTVATKRSRLATYAQLYDELHGQATLVDRVVDDADRAAEIRRVLAVFDELDIDLGTDASKQRYLSDVNQFYSHLERRAIAAFNPASRISEEYNWNREEKDNQPLSSEDVRRLSDAAEEPEEELLVLALCAWGLRRNEVASLHVSQLVLEEADPHIYFEERKNGPGTVALVYGREQLRDHLDRLGGHNHQWNGYLFPSTTSSSGHIVGETVQSRFQRLANRAGVTVDGEIPTSKMGRRFWYTTYMEAQKQLLENLDVIAGDQGSSDANVVLENYLSEAERRKYRREFMHEQLADVFEADPRNRLWASME